MIFFFGGAEGWGVGGGIKIEYKELKEEACLHTISRLDKVTYEAFASSVYFAEGCYVRTKAG